MKRRQTTEENRTRVRRPETLYLSLQQKLHRSCQPLGGNITARNKAWPMTLWWTASHRVLSGSSEGCSGMLMKLCLHLEVTADGPYRGEPDSCQIQLQRNLIPPDTAHFQAALAGPAMNHLFIYSKWLHNHRPLFRCSASPPPSTEFKSHQPGGWMTPAGSKENTWRKMITATLRGVLPSETVEAPS